ncbi:phasin family protein [Halomonas organivorans]
MTKATTAKTNEQFESLFVKPLQAYGALNLEVAEKLVATQFDVAQAVSETTLAQARAWLSVQDPEGFKQAMEGQQKAAQALGERLKADSETLMSLGQDYVQKGQKLVEDQVKAGSR